MRFLIVFIFCFFINTLQAENLGNYLTQKYGYQKFNLLDNYENFPALYLIGEVNNSKAYILFDTGSNGISIFNRSLKQLGLKEEGVNCPCYSIPLYKIFYSLLLCSI
ncbi:hypothetical protein fh0823_06030 [Francisella halioticida]|uniref:hypothetical protein n=1 Tax=Francisella halioticida TaxID=549298 RepID=UPI001AF92AC9|nr:hypothetical protein [Francisella halioticida]BCD90464.1 hypothetical protein fh0823_06030 [Francisella halioticida]